MSSPQPIDLLALLRRADHSTRREFFQRAALVGLPLVGALLNAPAAEAAVTAPTRSTGTAPAKPRRGGTFITMSHQDVTSLSPDEALQAGFRAAVANIHEGLLKVDENYKVQPALAETYAVSADGKTWTFNLRANVKWHDGQPFTSADVKYNFEFVMDEKNGMTGRPVFADVENVATPDPATVVVTLKQPNAPFAVLTATRLLMPKHYHEQVGEKTYKQQPMGTGPWKLKEFATNSHVLLEANQDYWGGAPLIDFWRQNVVPEPSVRAIALRTGEADATTWPLTPEDILKLVDDPKFRTYRSPGTVMNYFPINTKLPFFSDKRVRQAMLHAIDRDALVRDLMRGLAVKATSNLSPALVDYYEPNVKQYDYNPDRAKALLSEAGWTPGSDGVLTKDGQRFAVSCIVFTGDALRRGEAEIAQRQLKTVGIEMTLREMEVSAGITAGRKGDFEMGVWNSYFGGDRGEPDARDSLKSGALNNFPQWANPETDRLLAAGAAANDLAARQKVYSELQKQFAEEVPVLFIMFWENAFHFNRRIKGLPESATNPAWLFQEIHRCWIEE